jgi:hypothetical protein
MAQQTGRRNKAAPAPHWHRPAAATHSPRRCCCGCRHLRLGHRLPLLATSWWPRLKAGVGSSAVVVVEVMELRGMQLHVGRRRGIGGGSMQ